MQDLIKQEQFELEVLDGLNSVRILEKLVFIGGTMLRLCYGLNRFSVDLDFWLYKKSGTEGLFNAISTFLNRNYVITDSQDKFNTLLFEIKSEKYPRRLKIEIRKKVCGNTEQSIAYSQHSVLQVLLKTLKLEDIMEEKTKTFLERGEIRDVFDVEFLYKKGYELTENPALLRKLLNKINSFTANDYKVKLGSLVQGEQRKYYIDKNFSILKDAIGQKLNINDHLK